MLLQCFQETLNKAVSSPQIASRILVKFLYMWQWGCTSIWRFNLFKSCLQNTKPFLQKSSILKQNLLSYLAFSFIKMSFGKKLFLQVLWCFSLIGLSSQTRSPYTFVVSTITSYHFLLLLQKLVKCCFMNNVCEYIFEK